jgi:hypothetical protein
MDTQPKLVAHADWSVASAKRWLALAALQTGAYQAQPPQPVGDPQTLLSRLRAQAGPEGAVLLGVDFPMGLPLAYAERAGVDDFTALLPQLGQGEWRDFYNVAERREEISLHRPFYPLRPGGARQSILVQALGLLSAPALLRRCDCQQPDRPAAAPLFWTIGAQQVGKAAISGWRDLLAPGLARGDLALWPFDGPLADLLRSGRIVVAETYPAECYRHLGLSFSQPRRGGKTGKRVQMERAGNAQAFLRWASDAGVDLQSGLSAAIGDGFGASGNGEDRFDTVVGLLGLINIVLGRRPPGDPTDLAIRHIEGWILGQIENKEKDGQNELH